MASKDIGSGLGRRARLTLEQAMNSSDESSVNSSPASLVLLLVKDIRNSL